MIVEKPEILKQWMTETMEPLCDAEPAKLAKYVLALIKKDMPPDQLRLSMKNNLDIFLHDQAGPFVDRLFSTLETKAYLPQPSPDSTTPVAAAAAAAPAPVEPPRRRVEPLTEPVGVRDRLGRRPGSRQRDRDDRVERPERKRSWEDRRRRSPVRERRLRRSRSPPRVRTKSRSPSRNKSKSPPKPRVGRSRSRSPRSRTRSRSRSRTPRRNRSKSPIKFERSPPAEASAPIAAATPAEKSEPAAATAAAPAPAAAPNGAAAVPVTDLRQKLQASSKQRCRDYDEKGLCMRGDQCPFDHGADPVILQDVSMPLDVLKYSAPPPAAAAAAAAAITVPPPAVTAAPPPPLNPMTRPPPRPPMLEPYNPDAPSLTVAAAAAPVWVPSPNYTRPPPPPHVRPPYFAAAPGGVRQLVPVPVGAPPPPAGPLLPPTRHPYQPPGRDQNEPPRKRGHFDASRLGNGAARSRYDPLNSSLELRKVPAGLNQISHLNNHFAKFGKVTNIQVCFGGDPEAALVTFSAPAEAKAAYKCTEAVLNNRFIKVFWHNKERGDAGAEAQPGSGGGGGGAAGRAPVKTRLGAAVSSTEPMVVAGAGGQLTRTVTNPEALKQQQDQQAAAKQQSIDAINHSQQMLAAKVSLHAKTLEKQKEALKLAADLRKRKSDLLEKQLAHQRALLSRLESKQLKPEERRSIVVTVKDLQKAIENTRAAVRSAGDGVSGAAAAAAPKLAAKEAAEKEVLDAEMDLYQKQQAGVDTTQLQRHVAELRQQLSARRGRGRGRGAARAGRGRGRGSLSYVPSSRPTTVDRRPTKLSISGFELDEKAALLIHLAQFGEICEHVDDDVTPSVVVTFRTRQEAETALSKGRHFNDRLLTANWHVSAQPAPTLPQIQPPPPAGAAQAPPKAEEGECELLLADGDGPELMQQLDEHLLAGDDEEEEEDAEERSWRR